MIYQVAAVVISAICIIHVYRFIFRKQYEKYDVIYKHYPGPCKQLLGPDGGGSEDLTTLPDGLTFISSGLLPSKQGRILMFDFNDRKEKLTELKIDRPISNFHPHGISVWQEPKSDSITLFIVNHGDVESVEVVEYKRGSTVLKHIKTILTGGRTFNDIVAVAKDKFYGTQYMEYTNTWLLAEIEQYAMLDLGKLWFYDGQELKLIASGFGFPNGINASPDLKYIYMATYSEKRILAFKRNDDNSLELIQKVFIDTGPDNIEVDPKTGDLWIGCHARSHQIETYSALGGKGLSASQVLKIKTKDGNLTSDITEIFLDDGHFCSGSATPSYYKGRMILGTVGTELIICDVLNNN